jgi:hypothetical protein
MAPHRPPRGRAQSPGRDHRARPGRRRATHARAATEASRFGATRRAEGYRALVLRLRQTIHSVVMAGLVPAVHELRGRLAASVDARHKAAQGRA